MNACLQRNLQAMSMSVPCSTQDQCGEGKLQGFHMLNGRIWTKREWPDGWGLISLNILRMTSNTATIFLRRIKHIVKWPLFTCRYACSHLCVCVYGCVCLYECVWIHTYAHVGQRRPWVPSFHVRSGDLTQIFTLAQQALDWVSWPSSPLRLKTSDQIV